jgi:hypothetical protein
MEPCSHPVWRKRAKELVLLLPADITELVRRASVDLRWSGDLTRNVLAWGEGRVFVERLGKWVALRGVHGQKTGKKAEQENDDVLPPMRDEPQRQATSSLSE